MVRPRKQTGPPGTPMPQQRTQPPQTPGLEAGAAYGEVSDSLAAQSQMPLVQKGPPGTTGGLEAVPVPLPTQVSAGPLPLEAATGYTPQVTPLTAPGRGGMNIAPRLAPTPNQDAAAMLQNWAEAVNDPALAEAAIQLSQ